MKSSFSSLLVWAFLLLDCGGVRADDVYGKPPPDLSMHLERLQKSYPNFIKSVSATQIELKDGKVILISDGRMDKKFQEFLEKPDIDDMFAFSYPAGAKAEPPPKNHDPGRIRFEPLFLYMYGDCKTEYVRSHLRKVAWMPSLNGGEVEVTTINGVDSALAKVVLDLEKLPTEQKKFLKPNGGTYNCRKIVNSNRLSMHAYGAAIDINTKYSNYWEWSKKGRDPVWKNRIPFGVVDAFEKHGFIWGGRWYHYDTMHFEYRPEILQTK